MPVQSDLSCRWAGRRDQQLNVGIRPLGFHVILLNSFVSSLTEGKFGVCEWKYLHRYLTSDQTLNIPNNSSVSCTETTIFTVVMLT